MFQGLQESQLAGAIEAMLFVTDEPVGVITLADMLEVDPAQVEAALVELRDKLAAEERGVQLREVAGGWRLFTHPVYHELIEKYVLSWDTRKLSAAAMETLAIVAYTQPVTRAGVASVRGVNSDSSINSLVEKGLVREVGTEDAPGNPVLYGTTRGFLEKFGLRSPADLPDLADFAPDEETRRLITERLSATRKDAVVSDEQARTMARALMGEDFEADDGEAILSDEELAQGGKARHGRRIQRQKSPSIGGPVLVIVIVFLAAFLVYAFFGDKISSLFEKTDKPSVEDVTPAPSPTPDTSVTLTLDQQTLTLVEGGSTKLTVSGAENCIWTSSNTAAATVSDDGTVTAVGAGSATVSVTTADGSATATCSVTVTAKQDLRMAYDYGTTYFEKLDIWTIGSEDFDTTLKVGESFRMCMLSGGEKISAEIQWSTSNGSVATISDGNLLTGVASGETVLTAVVDGQTFTAIIRVK